MKILNINQNYYERGGSDAYFFALARLLEKHGHSVIPFASAQSKNIPSPWSPYFPTPVNFDRPRLMDLARFVYSRAASQAMQRLLVAEEPQLAHLHIYYGQLTSSILAPLKGKGVPVVQTLHEYKLVCPTSMLFDHGHICEACEGSKFWQATVKRCNRGSLARSALSTVETYASHLMGAVGKVDHFLAVSHFLREKVISLGVPASKVTTIHNFIDANQYSPTSEVGAYILYFGRLERVKGIFTLLDAMANLRHIKLLIVGDGNDRLEFERVVADKRLLNVQFLGYRRGGELHDLIRGSICTVSPSVCYETFGLTLIESFALGRPVICSRMGGMPEIVSDGEDGFIVPPGDTLALSDRIAWMADHAQVAVAMGAMGRRKVEREFTPTKHYDRLMSVYSTVTQRRQAS
jgi:glycosyltransferase involved in cell wall biosynthesis